MKMLFFNATSGEPISLPLGSIAECYKDLNDNYMTLSCVLVDLCTTGILKKYFGRQWVLPINTDINTISLNVSDVEAALNCKADLIAQWNSQKPEPNELCKLVITLSNRKDETICCEQYEFVILDSKLELLLISYASKTQANKKIDQLVSAFRFLSLYSEDDIYSYIAEKNMYVSGCGTGAEVKMLADLGAKSCIGIDISVDAIEIAKCRFEQDIRVNFFTDNSDVHKTFDTIISRHVLEHVKKELRKTYLMELCEKLDDNGILIIEFPNQKCPIEPHTGIDFFHLLPIATRKQVFDYIECYHPEYEPSRKSLIKSLLEHENIIIEEFFELCELVGLVVVRHLALDCHLRYIDSELANFHRVFLAKKT